jgi:hypothetical protein
MEEPRLFRAARRAGSLARKADKRLGQGGSYRQRGEPGSWWLNGRDGHRSKQEVESKNRAKRTLSALARTTISRIQSQSCREPFLTLATKGEQTRWPTRVPTSEGMAGTDAV